MAKKISVPAECPLCSQAVRVKGGLIQTHRIEPRGQFCPASGSLFKKPEPKTTRETRSTIVETAAKAELPTKKSVGWRWRQENGPFGILHIENGGGGDYLVHALTTISFLFTKLEITRTTTYCVRIGEKPLCGCEGFKQRQTCKHLDALNALDKEGKL